MNPRTRDDERGAVIVMVAVFMTAALGSAAIAMDLGNGWQEKRKLHTATDAAALAAAQVYALNGNGCASAAGTFVTSNDSNANGTTCSTHTGSVAAAGWVTVSSGADAQNNFASAPTTRVGSSTTAEWGIPASADGMRPLALCKNYPAVATWLTNPTSESASIQVPYSNGNIGCSNAPGNWNLLDYDGPSGGASEIRDWLLSGYPDPVSFPSQIGAQTGHITSISSALQSLQTNGTIFPVVLFDTVAGNGANATYNALGAVLVKLISFNINGSPSGQYMTFKLEPGILSGSCCGSGPDTGARVVTLCAVDKTPTSTLCKA